MNYTFQGIDASKEISLLEYGLLVSNEPHKDGSGSHFCVYRQSSDSFGTAHIYPKDIDSLLQGKDWANEDSLKSFFSFIGCEDEREDYIEQMSLVIKLNDLVSYFGEENICGTDYYPITEAEAIEKYLG